ncbi:MAG: tetratricopeptide repeat protein [Propionibacteriaceae bacterium]|jgi:putative thioredoxin|nr:tetratricopeptide repeat protein [Propionibacteriaceae bacterium]
MAQISGAVDLSGLSTPPPVGGSYVTEVSQETFEETLRKSIQHPVVIEFYSSKAPESQAMGETLTSLVNAAGGSWLLARMNIDNSAQIVQALQINAVPMVVGVLGGQLVPLWQGSMAKEEAEKVIAELLKMAAGNGILGKATPVVQDTGSTDSGTEGEDDPRYTLAYEAMATEDYAQAQVEFEKLLAQNPNDPLAKTGKAQAGLLSRVAGYDPVKVKTDVDGDNPSRDAVLAAADIAVAMGDAEQGFSLLIAAIAETSAETRDLLRVRLLELFDTQDPSDKVVLSARRNLATALF